MGSSLRVALFSARLISELFSSYETPLPSSASGSSSGSSRAAVQVRNALRKSLVCTHCGKSFGEHASLTRASRRLEFLDNNLLSAACSQVPILSAVCSSVERSPARLALLTNARGNRSLISSILLPAGTVTNLHSLPSSWTTVESLLPPGRARRSRVRKFDGNVSPRRPFATKTSSTARDVPRSSYDCTVVCEWPQSAH